MSDPIEAALDAYERAKVACDECRGGGRVPAVSHPLLDTDFVPCTNSGPMLVDGTGDTFHADESKVMWVCQIGSALVSFCRSYRQDHRGQNSCGWSASEQTVYQEAT